MAEPGKATRTAAPESASEEILLRDRLRRIAESPSGYFAVHIHLSALLAANRKPKFIRIAARAFDAITTNADATLFMLASADLVLVCREVPVDDVDDAVAKVRNLFSEDPLASAAVGSLDDRFATWYDLGQQRDFATFLNVATRMAERARQQPPAGGGETAAPTAMTGKALDPGNLAAINQMLENTRIADLIRRQSAIEIHPGGRGSVVFREHYISMLHLQRRIAPGVNLFGNTWLFQYLTETLDKRMLMVIARRGLDQLREPISLNLNISTILSREFHQFHHVAGDYTHKVVIELQMIDVVSDMTAYFVARDTLRGSGYRVLVDGLTPLTLQFFDPSVLASDFVKLTWNREFMSEIDTGNLAEMRSVIHNTGPDTVVLARVDSEDAIRWGLSLGIHKYQGHFVDKLVEAMQTKGIL